MARAVVSSFATQFGAPFIQDDVTNGWFAKFQVFYLGEGASGGFMVEEIEVHFLDSDTPQSMETKIRDAARAKAVELNVTDGATISVTSFATPRKL